MIAALACLALSLGSSAPIQTRFDGKRWWLDGGGIRFWSFGVDCVDSATPPAKQKPDNPAFSAERVWGSDKAWAKIVQAQLGSWGFNTLGGWCDVDKIKASGAKPRLPYTIVLHLGAYDMAPWHDLFAPAMEQAMDGAAKAQIPRYRNDPYLIGYFSDNELGWWDDTLFSSYLSLGSDSPGRLKLIELLKTTYHGDLEQLRQDWITDATTFETLKDLKLRPGGKGRLVIKAWTGELAEKYYKLSHDLIRRYDETHLILGDRYCQYYTLPVVRAAQKYVDVISTNYGADWNNGQINHFYFDTLHSASGNKPVIVTEFYMCAKQNRSGDRNSSAGFPLVETQTQRAEAFAQYVRSVASLPYLIGAHWFQYYDEPGKGRGDGENYNMGLVDVYGKPYEQLVQASKSVRPASIHEQGRPTVLLGVAPAPKSPLDGLKTWDKDKGFVPPVSADPIADLYAAWRPGALYLAIDLQDYCDKSLYVGGKVPESERASFQVKLSGMIKPIIVRFGEDARATLDGPAGVQLSEQPGLKHTVILSIPANAIGDGTIKPGRRFKIDAIATSHGRAETVTWDKTVTVLR